MNNNMRRLCALLMIFTLLITGALSEAAVPSSDSLELDASFEETIKLPDVDVPDLPELSIDIENPDLFVFDMNSTDITVSSDEEPADDTRPVTNTTPLEMFEIVNGRIIAYKGSKTDVGITIPKADADGIPITAIGDGVFKGFSNLSYIPSCGTDPNWR